MLRSRSLCLVSADLCLSWMILGFAYAADAVSLSLVRDEDAAYAADAASLSLVKVSRAYKNSGGLVSV